MTISQLAVSQSESRNFLNKYYLFLHFRLADLDGSAGMPSLRLRFAGILASISVWFLARMICFLPFYWGGGGGGDTLYKHLYDEIQTAQEIHGTDPHFNNPP